MVRRSVVPISLEAVAAAATQRRMDGRKFMREEVSQASSSSASIRQARQETNKPQDAMGRPTRN